MNIYTKLREAVERSILGGTIEVVSEGTHSTVSYNNKTISPYLLLAELKKLEEEDDTNRRAFAKEFDKKLKEECLDQGESETMPRSKCCGAPIVYCSGSKGEEVILCPKCMKTESSIVWGSKTGVTDCPACSGKGNIHKNCVMRGLPPLTKGPCQKHDTSCLVYHGKEPCHCWDNAPCTCGEEVHLPPLTKEEKDYYEGLRPKKTKGQGGPDELWRQFFVWIKDESDDSMSYWALKDGYEPMDVVAEARKKTLEEVRDEVMSLEKKGDGELWQWRTFKVWLVNKFDEMK